MHPSDDDDDVSAANLGVTAILHEKQNRNKLWLATATTTITTLYCLTVKKMIEGEQVLE
jgi:hypothetical protein